MMNARGLLIDLDGTLYTEDGPIPGARDALARLDGAGILYRYVTNTTRRPRREIVARFRALGFQAPEGLLFPPAAAADAMREGKKCRTRVAEALLDDLPAIVPAGGAAEYVLVGDLGH